QYPYLSVHNGLNIVLYRRDKVIHPSTGHLGARNRRVPPPHASRSMSARPYKKSENDQGYGITKIWSTVPKPMRYKLWNEVVTELMNSDVKVSKSEMRELEIQLQKKWKSIRDCFQKYVANPNRTKKPYIYSRQLQFLLKDQEELPRKEDGGGTTESDDDRPIKKKKVWRSKKKLKLVKEESSEDDNDNSVNFEAIDDSRDYTLDTSETGRSAKVPKISKPQVDEFAFASVDTQMKTESDDPDRMFLLSLLPHLKTIPEEFRLNVKMDMMHVLRNASYNSAREHKLI
ncbi:hypothetical protein HW555_012369, partial [Spodoptera exigua]